MLYDDLAQIHSDLEWALLEIRFKLRFEPEGDSATLNRADAALDRLYGVVAALTPRETKAALTSRIQQRSRK